MAQFSFINANRVSCEHNMASSLNWKPSSPDPFEGTRESSLKTSVVGATGTKTSLPRYYDGIWLTTRQKALNVGISLVVPRW